MPTISAFNYAIVRVVPYVEREEFINVGVILFCRTERFLEAKIALDRDRLLALAPDCNEEQIRSHLDLIPQICAGAGPIGQLSLTERFHWLVAPRSTIIQTSAVHTGRCLDPKVTLNKLLKSMVMVRL